MTTNVDHRHTDEIVCPWCGYALDASWEMGEEGTTECEMCEKPFMYSTYVEVTYTTWKEEDNV